MENLNSSQDFNGKLVFVRVDFNVPLGKQNEILSFKRINSTVRTLDYLREKGARIILCSHLGRPKGQVVPDLSLKPVFDYLQKKYGAENVLFSTEIVGKNVEKLKENLKKSQILLLENVRFHIEEEECDLEFAKKLANNVDFFVDEAFAVSHRKSASNYLMAKLLPSFSGFNAQEEMKNLTLKDKERPILAILGGAKVSDKIKLLESLIDKVDTIYVGGAIAMTFFALNGIEIGKSLFDAESFDVARKIMHKAKEKNVELVFPQDVVVSLGVEDEKNARTCKINEISENEMGLDIGENSIQDLRKLIEQHKTIFWNGPLGVCSNKTFENGTTQIVKALSELNNFSIVGGGDTVEIVEKLGLEDKISFVSTGGGASLNYIQKE